MVGDEAEVVGVDALADVLHHAVRIVRVLELVEVVEAVWNDGARIGHVEELAGQLRREVLCPVGEAVVVEVGEQVCVRLDLVEVGNLVGKAREALGRRLPRVGRRVAAVEFLKHGECAARRRGDGARIVVVERADLRIGEGVGRAFRAEHHVEFPAVEHAVAVVVRVVRHEREAGPCTGRVDFRLGAETQRLEVANEEVLVERRERFGVHRVVNGHGRERVVAVLLVHLRMDAHGGDILNLVHPECSRRISQVRANAVVDSKGVVGEDRVIVLGHQARERQVVAHAHGLVRRVDEVLDSGRVGDEPPGFLDVGHHVTVQNGFRILGERIGSGEHGFPAVRHAVAVGVPEGGVGVGVTGLFVCREAVAVNVGGVGAGRCGGGSEERFVVKAVGHVVLVDVRILYEDFCGRHVAALRDDLDRGRSVDVHKSGSDLVRVAPAFAALADAVVVAVDVGEGVVGPFLKAEEADYVRVVRKQLYLAVNVKEARLRGGVACEVGSLVQLHHHA